MTTNKPEVKRYTPAYGVDSVMRGHLFMEECDHGAWVSLEDYEALQAECEQLRTALQQIRGTIKLPALVGGKYRQAITQAVQLIDAAMQEEQQ